MWSSARVWIEELGMVDYHLSNGRILAGDLENVLAVNSIILITKKIIYNAMKKEQIPNIYVISNVMNDVKNFYYQERYRHHSRGKGIRYDKSYILLSNII